MTTTTIPIERVRKGDAVYHLGKWRTVVATSFTTPPPTYTLTLDGGLTIVAKQKYKLEVRRT